MFLARSAIYVHRRSLLLVSSSSYYSSSSDGIDLLLLLLLGFPKVMGLIIIGETVACTLRVIFSGDFMVPKKKCVKSTFRKPGDGKVDPDFWHFVGYFFEFVFEKSAFTIPSQNGSFLSDLTFLVISAFTIPSQNDPFCRIWLFCQAGQHYVARLLPCRCCLVINHVCYVKQTQSFYVLREHVFLMV